MTSRGWTDSEVESLRSLLRNPDLNYTAIGAMIGGRTKSAICAKVDRLGWGRTVSDPRPSTPIKTEKPKLPAPPLTNDAQKILDRHRAEAETREQLTSLFDLGERECHFPLGDPRESKDIYCGRPAVQGMQYCASCARRMYGVPEKKEVRVAPARRSAVATA